MQKLIGIVLIIDPEYAPYLENYTRLIEESNLDYEVVFWKRFDGEINYQIGRASCRERV